MTKSPVFVSVVTGTYNRLKYLVSMMNSVRKSVGIGIPYEIVVVDGGSTDGTGMYCSTQPDVVYINQGELLGAVKAFNAGAHKAQGKYVILANDDIQFLGYSILSAISFMEDNPYIGIGCFYQDRRGWQFHVEQMPAVLNGKQISTYYGQVCIVRKWLGDMVGWWGDYLHTYGGDNELSCNVLELGYKVEPIPCAYIHDETPDDELRRKNNNTALVHNQHPDTYAWLKKWTRKGLVGPIIDSRKIDKKVETRLLRFFYMPIYEHGHPIQRTTKRGLRDALARIGLVAEADYMNENFAYIIDKACAIDPQVYIIQFQHYTESYMQLLRELKDISPNSVFVNWNGDYHPDMLFSRDYIDLMRQFDHVGVVTTSVEDVYNREGVNWFYWQIGYEETTQNPDANTPRHDVLFLGNGYSEARIDFVSELQKMRTINLGIYGSWPSGIKAYKSTLYDFNAGAKLYKACKIALGDSQWPQATGFVSNRLFQAMAAGAFLLHQYFDGMEECLGLQDGKHLVVWYSIRDLKEKIEYYLTHDKEREEIAKAGCKFVRTHHSFDCRVRELLERLGRA